MKKLWINRFYIGKLATKVTGGIFAFIGIISTLVPLDNIFSDTTSFCWRIIITLLIVAGVWLLCFIGCLLFVLIIKRIKLYEVNNGYSVYVQYGDLFSNNIISDNDKKRNIVIPVNRCFDTIVDNDLITERSLHGMFLKKLYSSKKYNENSLNRKIQDFLYQQKARFITIEKTNKRKGNLKRFDIGTIAEVDMSASCKYFLLGLTTFDSNLHAHVSNEEYSTALVRLIEYCNTRSQGFPVIIPLIGGGASNSQKSEKDILDYMIGLLKANRNIINSDIYIVVRNSGRDNISIFDYK